MYNQGRGTKKTKIMMLKPRKTQHLCEKLRYHHEGTDIPQDGGKTP